MGILDKMNRKRFEKQLNANSDLVYDMINNANMYYFNQGLISQNEVNKTNVFTRSLQENATWNAGIVENLEWFYKNTYAKLTGYSNASKPALSYFWAKVTPKTVRVHSGIPALISKTMVNMITGPGMTFTVNEVEGEEENVDTDRLDVILSDNQFQDVLFPTAENMKSYGGYVGWKLNYDKSVSDYPIIEFVRPENFEVVQKRGRNVAYISKSIFEEKEDTFELHEVYSKDENGTPIIYYRMYRYDGADLIEVDINEKEYPTLLLNGLDEIPAGLINNTALNQQFKGSPYGQSDYNNSQSIYNGLDETLSQLLTAVRMNKSKRFFSKDLLPENASGVKSDFDDFEMDYELVDPDPDTKIENQYIPIENKIDMLMYDKTGSMLLLKAINNAGLSPSTMGVRDLEGKQGESAESQREREKASLNTRELKLKIWRKELVRMFRITLKFEDVVINEVTPQEYNVSVNFNDFTIPGFEQRVELANKMLAGGTSDVANAVDIAWADDKSKEEKEIITKNIKLETGVPLTEDEVNSGT